MTKPQMQHGEENQAHVDGTGRVRGVERPQKRAPLAGPAGTLAQRRGCR
jgi:hypothetical protein